MASLTVFTNVLIEKGFRSNFQFGFTEYSYM